MRINKKSLRQIKKLIDDSKRRGLRTYREVYESDLNDLIKACRRGTRRIRVYSSDGFVPNSYRGRCTIEFLEALVKNEEWHIDLGTSNAQRSYANGPHIVIH